VNEGVLDFEAVLVVDDVPDRVFDGVPDGVTDGVFVLEGVSVELNELPLDGVFV